MHPIKNFVATNAVLLSDIAVCQRELTLLTEQGVQLFQNNPQADRSNIVVQVQFWRRAFVRALYAAIEANTYGLKQVAYALRDRPHTTFSVGELGLMHEEAYELKSNGDIRPIKAKLRFESNLRFAIKVCARATELPPALDMGAKGWRHLIETIEVRDRLMHPKDFEKLNVNDTEANAMVQAYIWFADGMGKFFGSLVVQKLDFPELFID